MRGDCPWVIPVDIICGGGSQALSDVVRDWIRANPQVVNKQAKELLMRFVQLCIA